MPRKACCTSPSAISCWATSRAVSIGTAKPMPTLPWLFDSICELTPTTSPEASMQCAAGVPGVDRGVGLDHVRDREPVGGRDLALKRRDDARGHGPVEPEGVADRDDRVADVELGRLAEGERLERVGGGVDLQDGDVGRVVLADELGLVALLVVAQRDLDLLGAVDHVRVGDQMALVVDHEARSRSRACSRRLPAERTRAGPAGAPPAASMNATPREARS